MGLTRSAHVDTFCRDHLPPKETWPTLTFDLPELQYPERLNCAVELLDETARRLGGDRPCVLSPDETWTYEDLRVRSNQVARVLVEDLGVVPGQRVLLRGPNNPWLAACSFGVVKAGAVVVTTMPLLRQPELEDIIGLTASTVSLCDHRFLDDLRAAAPDQPVVAYGGDGPDDLAQRCRTKSGEFTAVDTAADDVMMLATTSGTTGRPKATMHFHRDVLAIADTFSAHIVRPTADDLFSGTPPFAFTFGLGGLLIFPLRAGAATLLIEKARPLELAQLVHDHGVTLLSTAPTAYKAMIAGGAAGLLSGLRRGISAGETLPRATWEAFYEATGVKLIDGIGATEMLHVFISAADDAIRPGATGVPVPGYQARVVGPDGDTVPDGTPGRLAVIGPTGCRYLNGAHQEVYVQSGWNITGDTYIRDSDGYFFYQARTDDMIVSSGYNIGAPEVEAALGQHPDVAECAVVARPDDHRGSVVHAAVVLRDGVTGGADKVRELQDFVKAQIAPYKYPRSVEFVTELPRSATGKLQRSVIRQRVEAAGQ
jgi:2-aminobenzoate-CoA ligase